MTNHYYQNQTPINNVQVTVAKLEDKFTVVEMFTHSPKHNMSVL